MIQMLFFLRFRTQLRRTRPELIASLNDSIASAINAAGGSFNSKNRLMSVSFNEESLGFWLDIITLIETIGKTLEKSSSELFGYALILGRNIEDYDEDRLGRVLSSPLAGSGKQRSKGFLKRPSFLSAQGGLEKMDLARHTGVWCDEAVQEALGPYGAFEKSLRRYEKNQVRNKDIFEKYAELVRYTSLSGDVQALPEGARFPFREKILQSIQQAGERNIVIGGPEFLGKREAVYRFCAGEMGGVPPLVVRFGAGGRGLVCLADSLSPAIRSFLAGFVSGDALDELDSWGALLFQDRLRDELSPYVVLMARHFFTLLLEIYISAARNKLPRAVLIMEDILKADDMAARLFLEIYDSLERKAELRIFGTCHTSLTTDDDLKKWSRVFPQVVLYSRKDVAFQGTVQMPRELWEISYGFSLLGKYFPGFLFSQILAEEGIGNAMFEKALDMFISLGVADTREDPRPRIPGFASRVEYFLDDHRKEKVRALVRNRILAWISAGKIRPCFNLLKILSDLGWKRNDALILMAIRGDISNGTYLGIDEALRKNSFNLLVGEDNAQELRYIFQTMKALVHGDKAQIRKAFEQSVPGTPVSRPFSGYRAQIQANLVSYHLGMKELDAAAETVKKAMLLNQSLSDAAVPAYRLFSLVNLSKQQIDEALEYFSFALDHAERMKQFDELGIAAYFAAGAQFLFGNLARAERYALQSEQSSRALGRGEWADRSRFLRGKLRFEVGHYEEALEIFESLRRGGEEGILRDKDLTISAWTYRSKVFMAASGGGKFEKPSQPRFLKGDALLFEIEACYLARDYKRVLTLSAESQEACMMDDDFLFTEQPDWRSGFAQCELLSIPGNVLWDRMISVYAALARCHLTTSPDEKADILNSMQRFMRDEFIPDADPNAAVYLYVWYLILQASGAAQVDKNTAVSMAFKRLQLRASRIDDPETRRDYLNLHYWNGALSLAAKEYNLI